MLDNFAAAYDSILHFVAGITVNTLELVGILIIIIGSVMGTGTVWLMAEIVNGLMAIPNLLALILLSPELFKLTREYKRNPTQ